MLGANGQFVDIKQFFNSLPPNVEIGVGWLLQGHVPSLSSRSPRTANSPERHSSQRRGQKRQTRRTTMEIHFSALDTWPPTGPTPDPAKLRAVLMFTDGVTRSNGQIMAGGANGEQMNPDVAGASQSLQRAGSRPLSLLLAGPHRPGPQPQRGRSARRTAELLAPRSETRAARPRRGPVRSRIALSSAQQAVHDIQGEAVVTVNAPGKPGSFTRLDIKSARDDIKIFAPDSMTVGNVLKK